MKGKAGKIKANVVWLVGDRLVRMAVGVIMVGVVARYLEPARYGQLSYAISLVAMVTAVASLGIDGIVIRELLRHPNGEPRVLGTAWVLKMGGAVLAISLASLLALVLEGPGTLTSMVVIVGLAFFPQSLDVIDLWFQRHVQSRSTVIAKMVALTASTSYRIYLVKTGAPVESFAWAQSVEVLFMGLALIHLFHQRGGHVRTWRFDPPLARLILRDAWPLIFAGILVAVYQRVEQVLVKRLLTEVQTGVYYAALRITDMWNFIPNVLLSTLYPMLLEKRAQDPEVFRSRMQLVFDLLTLLGFAAALGATLLGGWFIHLIYGTRYEGAIPILMVQAWFAPITFSGAVRSQYMLMENKNTFHIGSALLGIAVNLALGYYWMQRVGPVGAAGAALVGYWTSSYLTSYLFSPLRDCARMQTRAFMAPLRLPKIWAALRSFSSR